MKPFSPLYFIKENKARCAVLIFMIFLSFAAYLAGLYVMNVITGFEEFGEELYDSTALVFVKARDEEGFQGYRNAVEAIRQEEEVHFVDLGYYNHLNVESIMSFTVGYQSLTFISKEDFKLFCEMNDISCDVNSLSSRSAVMSERMANRLGLKVGDVLTPEEFSGVSETFTLEAITNQTTYAYYFLAEGAEPMNAMVLNTGLEKSEFAVYLDCLEEQYPVRMHGYEEDKAETDRTFSFLPKIYIAVLVLLAVIMAVTVNAVFVGVYQSRTFEFAVYRAVGMGKRKITGKIVGELLWMEGIALIGGGVLFVLGLYLFNHLVLYPKGLYLDYFNNVALFGLVLCNVIILVPLILTRCRQMHRADICEY
ncbi:MAG: ABC transporter permease [Lachnospiraceae bacterium]|nr:ABC transporter permease [Lachnospiraceae bacterium]